MELRVLMDADLLDELGLTIIMWDAMDEGHRNQGGYYSVLSERVKTGIRAAEKTAAHSQDRYGSRRT